MKKKKRGMKKAKVRDGVIQHVWPWVKKLPDGTEEVRELPPQYRGYREVTVKCADGTHKVVDRIPIPVPDGIIDVPEDVQPKWVWNEEKQAYAPRVKVPIPPRMNDPLKEIIAEFMGITYDELIAECKRRKQKWKDENGIV